MDFAPFNGIDRDEFLCMDLHTAASIGYEERIRCIIDSSHDKGIINSQNGDGWTPLMYAACSADKKAVLLLLEEGANPTLKNKDGHTALMLATKYGSTDVASLLIDHGGDISDIDSRGWSVLFHASCYGYRSLVQLLLEKAALVNYSEEKFGLTALILASAAGHAMIVKDLLSYGADPSHTLKSGETAKCLAIKEGHVKVTEIIDAHIVMETNSVARNIVVPRVSQPPSNVFNVLESLNLGKYYPVFASHEIDINQFWLLDEDNLKEIGIGLLGPRKKILSAIARFHHHKAFSGSSEEHAYANQLLMNNQKLMDHINELSELLSQEKENTEAAGTKLNEEFRKTKNFVRKIKGHFGRSGCLHEQLKRGHHALAGLLYKTLCESPNVDIINMLSVLDGVIQSLLEEQHTLYEAICLYDV